MKGFLRRIRPTWSHAFRFLGALGLALVVWAYVTGSQNPLTATTFKELPLEARGLSEGLVLTDAQGLPLASLGTVSLILRVPQEEHLTPGDLHPYVDLTSISEAGVYELTVQLEAPRAVRSWRAEPTKVTVHIERRAQEILPVEVVLVGQPGLPYVVGTPLVDPAQALVQGPESRVQLVTDIQARVDLGGRVASLQDAPVQPVAVDSAGRRVAGVEVLPAEVAVDVPISLQGGHLAVSVVPHITGIPAPGYYIRALRVVPDTVTIFSGDPNVLARVRFLETMPVSVEGLRDDLTTTVGLDLPANVSLIQSPSQVTVSVDVEAIEPVLRIDIPVHLAGLLEPLQATWEPRWLSVLLRAPLELLERLSLGDLWAVVDVSGLDAGEYDLPASFSVPPEVEVTPEGPATVHVVIVRRATPTPTR
ncbi:MAG: CdaR family protein, partial [Chloroflexia bacterium]